LKENKKKITVKKDKEDINKVEKKKTEKKELSN